MLESLASGNVPNSGGKKPEATAACVETADLSAEMCYGPGVSFRPVVVLPTYNNSGTLGGILRRVARLGLPMVVVNDGATDDTALVLADWERDSLGILTRVIRHSRNSGKGAALRTGFEAAAAGGYTHAVTIDTDGQLDPEEIPALLEAARRHPSALVVGVRNAKHPDYPALSRWGRNCSNFMIWVESGQAVADSQCGFRVYPVAATPFLWSGVDRFGYEAEVITRAAWAGCPIVEVPVSCRYFPGSQRVSHFRPVWDTLRNMRLHFRLVRRALVPWPHRQIVAEAQPPTLEGAEGPKDLACPTRFETILALALFVLGSVLRVGYILRYRLDSDEPQHLHVAWGWAHGLMQYRDVFDNHSPLFQLLCSPLVKFLGDRADLLILMRFAMFPLFLLAVWLTYVIARHLFSRRVALWSAVCTALFPIFFMKTVEYRTDDLWMVWWLASAAVILGGKVRSSRALLAGLLLGGAFATSMKTSMLLTSFGVASLSVLLIRTSFGHPRVLTGRLVLRLLAGLVGVVAIPAVIVAWFWSKGALGPLYYGTIGHNLLSDLGHAQRGLKPLAIFIPAFCMLWLAVRMRIARGGRASTRPSAQAFVFMGTALYILVVELFWPLVTLQDYPPVIPFVIVFLVAGFDYLARRRPAAEAVAAAPRRRRLAQWAPALMSLLAVGFLSQTLALSRDCRAGHVEKEIVIWKALLALTTPDDTVLDPKGELIFRRRATYWGFETITRKRFQEGLLADTITQDLIANRTCVVWRDPHRYTDAARDFIASNYLAVGPLLVAGQVLDKDAEESGQVIGFDVQIAAQYALMGPDGPATGQLDGADYRGPSFLPVGHHEFRPSAEKGPLVMVWERSIEKGYSPFGKAHTLRHQ